MRVRGPVPSQSLHLARAVQDGMRRAMRRPSVGADPGADGGPTAPGTVQGSVLNFQSDPLPTEPIVEDRVKVSPLCCNLVCKPQRRCGSVSHRVIIHLRAKAPVLRTAWPGQVSIVPLVTVDIQELVPHDSGEDAEQAAVFIKPRRPASAQQLVSLVLEVTRERSAHATVRCELPRHDSQPCIQVQGSLWLGYHPLCCTESSLPGAEGYHRPLSHLRCLAASVTAELAADNQRPVVLWEARLEVCGRLG